MGQNAMDARRYSRRDQADVRRGTATGNGGVPERSFEQTAVFAIEETLAGLEIGNSPGNGTVANVVLARGDDLSVENESGLRMTVELKAILSI